MVNVVTNEPQLVEVMDDGFRLSDADQEEVKRRGE